MAKKITYAKLHDGFFIPGVGNMKDTLPPDNKSLPEFNMVLEDNGSITLTWTRKHGPGVKRCSHMIGAATVKSCSFPEEDVVE